MISFEEFRARYEHHPPLELLRMLHKLCASFERILLAGGDRAQRARTAEAILRAHEGDAMARRHERRSGD